MNKILLIIGAVGLTMFAAVCVTALLAWFVYWVTRPGNWIILRSNLRRAGKGLAVVAGIVLMIALICAIIPCVKWGYNTAFGGNRNSIVMSLGNGPITVNQQVVQLTTNVVQQVLLPTPTPSPAPASAPVQNVIDSDWKPWPTIDCSSWQPVLTPREPGYQYPMIITMVQGKVYGFNLPVGYHYVVSTGELQFINLLQGNDTQCHEYMDARLIPMTIEISQIRFWLKPGVSSLNVHMGIQRDLSVIR